jgi:hypothetical protein
MKTGRILAGHFFVLYVLTILFLFLQLFKHSYLMNKKQINEGESIKAA